MTVSNLDQRRAKHALTKIKERKNQTRQSDYLSYVKALPASILQNGLGQAMATLLAAAKSRNDDPHLHLYQDVEDWLCGNDENAPYQNTTNLLEAITSNDQKHYLRAQSEAQSYLDWLKKLASAYLKGDENE